MNYKYNIIYNNLGERILMEFCPECGKVLFPKDGIFSCDSCGYEKKVTEEDLVGLIKTELPYNSVEIKKRGSKGLKW
jgi:uncharacterized Zn finger protein (UPF0148 family)